tara:strand:+ start:1706 stop:2140 length:435 start_codon:yes stop_codon:yes gene_type:complete
MTTPITFDLDSSDYTAPLGFDVLLNNNVVFTTEHVAEPTTVTIDIDDDVDAEHELKFVLKNKTQDHTQVDEQGNILSDAMLSISNIAFDEIKLAHMFFEQTVYHHDFNGSQDLFEDEFYGDMGCNGYVSLKFATPIYLWLLENM